MEEKQNNLINQVVNDTLKLSAEGVGGSGKVMGNLDLLPLDYDKRQFPPRMDKGKNNCSKNTYWVHFMNKINKQNFFYIGSVNQISVTMDIFSIPALDEKKEV